MSMPAVSRFSALLFASLMLCNGGAFAQVRTLRVAHWMPPTHPVHDAVKAWAASLEKASGGTLSASVFPSSQLGAAKDHYDMAKNGLADVAWINMGYTPGRFPVADYADIPFLFGDAPAATVSRAYNDWYASYASKEMSEVAVCFVHVGPPGTFHTKKAVRKPEDLAGLKVRPGSAALSSYVADVGGSAVQIPAPEARSGLERGLADAITFPFGSLMLFNIDKAVNYHLDTRAYYIGAAMVMNKAMVQSLTPVQRTALNAHCNSNWAARFPAAWTEFEEQGQHKLGAGHQLLKPTDAERVNWIASTKPAQERWAKAVTATGYQPEVLAAGLKSALGKAGAAQ